MKTNYAPCTATMPDDAAIPPEDTPRKPPPDPTPTTGEAERGGGESVSANPRARLTRRRQQARKRIQEAREQRTGPAESGVGNPTEAETAGIFFPRIEEMARQPPAGLPEEERAKPAAVPAGRPRGRFSAPAPHLPWWRKVVPAAGLALCLGCLWALLGVPGPDWRWPWGRSATGGGVAVIIDPGHGGGDTGAVAQGVVEKDLNLDVARRVGRALRARGVTVRLTREDDHFVPLEDRVRFANALPGAVFVSIHFNDASGNGQATGRASGIETYYCERKLTPAGGWLWRSLLGGAKTGVPDAHRAVREGHSLADAIQGALIAGTRAENRGIKERSLYVTHRVLGPAVLVEGGFVSHPGEARRLGDPVYRQVLAECIAEGIVKYLHMTRTEGTLVAATGLRGGGE